MKNVGIEITVITIVKTPLATMFILLLNCAIHTYFETFSRNQSLFPRFPN
jgi:hypothetical protein